MVKGHPIPVSKEDMDLIMAEVEKTDEFDYMIFSTLKHTGRRIGELYGIEEVNQIEKKVVGKRTIYIDGKPIEIDRTIPKYKKTGRWLYGVKLKDINFEEGLMRVWVLKRRNYVQDETILTPELVRLISGYARKNRIKLDDFVFRKKKRSLRQIQNRIKMYAEKVGITDNISIHNFRHYFITELKRKGWTNDKIMKLTGHKSIGTLSIYDHVLASDIKEEAIEDIRNI